MTAVIFLLIGGFVLVSILPGDGLEITPIVTEHSVSALAYFHYLKGTAAGKLLHPFQITYNPPFSYLITAFFIFIGGTSPASIFFSTVFFLALILAATYRLGYILGNGRAGVLAGLLTVAWFCFWESEYRWFSYPFLKEYLLEMLLTAEVIWALFFLVKSRDLTSRKYSFLFGVVCGLGMITKWNFPIYLGPAALFLLWKNRRRAESKNNLIRAAFLCCLIFIPVYAAIFYFDHSEILSYLSSNLSLTQAKKLDMPSPLISARGWLFYPLILFKLMTPVLFPVFLISFYRFARRRVCPEITVTLFGSLIILSLLPSEVIRLLSPLLPLGAIVLATQCLALPWKTPRRIICGIIILISGWTIGAYYDLLPRRWPLSRLVTAPSSSDFLADSATIREIIRDIGLNLDSRRIPAVCVVPFHPRFRLDSFIFWSYCDNAIINVGPSWKIKGGNWNEAFAEADYVISTSGDLGPDWALADWSEISDYLKKNGRFSRTFQPLKTYPMRKGEMVTLYRRRSAHPGYRVIPPGKREDSEKAIAVFSDSIALNDFQVNATDRRKLSLEYRWECLKKMSRSYKIFVHFTKGEEIVFRQDHLPAHGRYPTHFWREGEIIEEKYTVEIPREAPGGSYQIWVGVWDRITTQPISDSRVEKRKDRINAGEVSVN